MEELLLTALFKTPALLTIRLKPSFNIYTCSVSVFNLSLTKPVCKTIFPARGICEDANLPLMKSPHCSTTSETGTEKLNKQICKFYNII